MCVSGQYCEGHLLLLLKILETSKDPSIRSNIVIALGDIAVSFGNIMDDVGFCIGIFRDKLISRIQNDSTRVYPIPPDPSRRIPLWF